LATDWEAKFFESTREQVVTQLRRWAHCGGACPGAGSRLPIPTAGSASCGFGAGDSDE